MSLLLIYVNNLGNSPLVAKHHSLRPHIVKNIPQTRQGVHENLADRARKILVIVAQGQR